MQCKSGKTFPEILPSGGQNGSLNSAFGVQKRVCVKDNAF
ncbi:hypothetical protein A2U01_0051167, partial [Trifolium medium]|nr:hypothetical protein [Trifolium medium]